MKTKLGWLTGKRIVFVLIVVFLLPSLVGCEAFVRKFTRKPKKDKIKKEEMILVPEEYKGPNMSQEELYRKYFLFWKSWDNELHESLSGSGANHKKQISCAKEAIKNLVQMKFYLNEEKQKKLDVYIDRLGALKELIARDVYSSKVAIHRNNAERIRRGILKDFSFEKIKDSLAPEIKK